MKQSIASSNQPSNEHAIKWNKLRGYRFLQDIKQLNDIVNNDGTECCSSGSSMVSNDTKSQGSHTFHQFLYEANKIKRLSTTISKLDEHPCIRGLAGGTITEFVGYPEVNKTHLCYKILVNLLLNDSNAYVVYITTNGTYSTEAVKDLIQEYTEDWEPLLRRIHVADVATFKDLMLAVNYIHHEHLQNNMVRLVIIDSIFTCLKDTSNLNIKVNHIHAVSEFVHSLKELAEHHQLPLILTNSITTSKEMKGEPKCYLGEHYAELIDSRVYLHETEEITVIIPPVGNI